MKIMGYYSLSFLAFKCICCLSYRSESSEWCCASIDPQGWRVWFSIGTGHGEADSIELRPGYYWAGANVVVCFDWREAPAQRGVKDFRFKRNGLGIQLLPMIMTILIPILYV